VPLPLEEIRKLFDFGRWANAKVLESVSALSAEEYARPLGGSFGSVEGTLVHLYGADWVWLERFYGKSPRALPGSDGAATLDALKEKWKAVEEGQQVFLSTLTPARLEEPLSYVNFAGESWTYPLGEALLHVVNHGTYHRGQIATLLRQLGKTPVATDFLRYIDAQAKA
jgi:uncharacterized damage-inducible protein DinB